MTAARDEDEGRMDYVGIYLGGEGWERPALHRFRVEKDTGKYLHLRGGAVRPDAPPFPEGDDKAQIDWLTTWIRSDTVVVLRDTLKRPSPSEYTGGSPGGHGYHRQFFTEDEVASPSSVPLEGHLDQLASEYALAAVKAQKVALWFEELAFGRTVVQPHLDDVRREHVGTAMGQNCAGPGEL